MRMNEIMFCITPTWKRRHGRKERDVQRQKSGKGDVFRPVSSADLSRALPRHQGRVIVQQGEAAGEASPAQLHFLTVLLELFSALGLKLQHLPEFNI